MDTKDFNEIIDFAIDKEKEAVKFYTDLQAMSQFKSRQDMLGELADMERGHVTALENIKSGKIIMREAPKVQNLKISDYLVAATPSPNMSYQDTIINAMKREEMSTHLYKDLAKLSAGEARDIFLRLAAEEAKHKLYFEKIYNDEVLKDN